MISRLIFYNAFGINDTVSIFSKLLFYLRTFLLNNTIKTLFFYTILLFLFINIPIKSAKFTISKIFRIKY